MITLFYYLQVYVYNEHVVAGSIRPSLVDMFLEVAKKIDDKVRIFFFPFKLKKIFLNQWFLWKKYKLTRIIPHKQGFQYILFTFTSTSLFTGSTFCLLWTFFMKSYATIFEIRTYQLLFKMGKSTWYRPLL